MSPFCPLFCPRCNRKLKLTVGTTNMVQEYLLNCPEPRCINISYTLDFTLTGVTYFLASQESSTVVSLVPHNPKDPNSLFQLTVGLGRDIIFNVKVPTFDPLDFSYINQIVQTYMVFS